MWVVLLKPARNAEKGKKEMDVIRNDRAGEGGRAQIPQNRSWAFLKKRTEQKGRQTFSKIYEKKNSWNLGKRSGCPHQKNSPILRQN